jgi:Cys-tRNA(Pro)/Cys-tRNA(Cys) deacylase
MTPAILIARRAGIRFEVREYSHDPACESYGLEAAQALGVDPERVFKTLLVAVNEDRRTLAVGVVPVGGQLDLKAMAAALGAKKASMADPPDAERVTGYLLGGISPLGQKRRLPTVVDVSAAGFPTVLVSAGRRGLEIELSPADLVMLTAAREAPIAKAR